MALVYMIALMVVIVVGEENYVTKYPDDLGSEPSEQIDAFKDDLANTELLMSFVVFRHGDRTPDDEEIERYPTSQDYDHKFFPYGKKALTNKGKQRGYLVGEYLRAHYYSIISKLYLPEEISVRTTDYARTKMTALTALSAMYPPIPAQRWHPLLNWQPIPYNTPAHADDDMLYYYNCPRYLALREQVYKTPEIKEKLKPYEGLFNYLTVKTGGNITTPEDVFFLDNLFQTCANVGIKPPKWALDVMAQIKEVTVIEYECEFYNTELIKLAGGVLLGEILNTTDRAIAGDWDQPKLHLYSAHENNVAAFLAAIGAFKPHQPRYGATVSLEFRKRPLTDQYGFTVLYTIEGGRPGVVLPVSGCGEQAFCDYDTFVNLTQDVVLLRADYKTTCLV